MPYCGENTLVKHKDGEHRATVLKCRSWSCPDCQPDRSRRLMAEGHGGRPVTFITLTFKTDQHADHITEAKALIHAFRLMRLRWRRANGMKPFPFLAVMEATKAGVPHLHILTRVWWIKHDWLSEVMDELANSPVVYLQRIKARSKIAAYVAKYCGKAPHQFGTCKRYWKSRDYEQRTRWKSRGLPEEGAWFEIVHHRFRDVVADWIKLGWAVEIVGVTMATARHATSSGPAPPPQGRSYL